MHESERQEQSRVQADGRPNSQPNEEAPAASTSGPNSAPEAAANAAEASATDEENLPAAAQGTGTSLHPFWYGFGQGMLNGFAVFNLPATVDLHRWFHEWWMENCCSPADAQKAERNAGTSKEDLPAFGAGSAETASTEEDALRGIQRLITQSFAEQETYTLTGYDVVYYVNDLNRANSEVLTTSTQEAEKAAQNPQAGTTDENYIYGVQRLYAEREESTETYLYDGRGSVVQLLQGGMVSQSYSYNAYGYINADEYGIQAPFYGYNGEQHDPATGLQYLRARYYAPQNGGFISQDSFAGLLTDALSQNQYTYVQNNPVNYIDPTGHVAKAVQPVAKTNSSGTGKITAPAVTKTVQSSQTKKTVTTIPTVSTLSSASTYTSGAAKAAQGAKMGSTAATSTAVTASVAKNSYATVTKAAGQAKLTPPVVTQSISNIAKFTRRTCNSSSNTISLQSRRESLVLLSDGTAPLDPDYQSTEWWINKVNQNHQKLFYYISQNPSSVLLSLALQYGMGLKEQESYLVLQHSKEAFEVYQAKNLAEIAKVTLFADDIDREIDGSRANAVLHAFWSAEITYRIGENLAEQFTTAHETYTLSQYIHDDILNWKDDATGITIGENVEMDMHNNAVGRELAAKLPDSAEDIHNELLRQFGSEENIANYLSEYTEFNEVDLLLLRYTEIAINDGSLVWLYNGN